MSEHTAEAATQQQTVTQRLILAFLNATTFYYVALKPSVQMATFVEDGEVMFTFVRNLVLIIAAYAATSKLLFKSR